MFYIKKHKTDISFLLGIEMTSLTFRMELGKLRWKIIGILLIFIFIFSPRFLWSAPVDLVDPFIGTANGGNTFPGALVPWGMVSVSPHTDLHSPSGYIYGNPFIYGFGHVHLSGTGCPDLGSVVLMPTTGEIQVSRDNWKSKYESESAVPGAYAVYLKTYDIFSQMSATTHAGISQYIFPSRKGDANILLDVGARLTTDPVTLKTSFESYVKIDSPSEVEGFTQSGNFCSPSAKNKQTVYFVAKFSKPAQEVGTWKKMSLSHDREEHGKEIGAYFRFSTGEKEPIEVKVGISYVSIPNARINLETEMPDWDLEEVKAKARVAWNSELSKIKVGKATPDHLKIFYTALYHCLIHPNVFSDVNGEYPSMGYHDVKSTKKLSYTRYTIFSLWDTYRNLHPLLTFLYPERELDMVRSLVEMAKEGGELPRWELAGNETGVMVGDPSVPVIVNTYLSGLKNFDVRSAYDAMAKSLSSKDNKVYGGLKSLIKFGYIPQDDDTGNWVWGSVSTSLEYSYDFWCLAQMAKELRYDQDYEKYIHFSGIYRNFYDSETGFLRAKNRDGSWIKPFDPQAICCDKNWPNSGGPGYVEGNAWQYLFFIPQDLDGLRLTMGSDRNFTKRLQECFEKGYYDATNEPDLFWSYLFNEIPGEAWRTQKKVRELMEKYYKPTSDGLPGNDDCGTLSAWYVFSALGFYPVCPGSGVFQIGSPIFQEVEVNLNQSIYSGRSLLLKTNNNSYRNVYIQSVLIDGVPYKNTFLRWEDLIYGKTIVFTMGPELRKKFSQ